MQAIARLALNYLYCPNSRRAIAYDFNILHWKSRAITVLGLAWELIGGR